MWGRALMLLGLAASSMQVGSRLLSLYGAFGSLSEKRLCGSAACSLPSEVLPKAG